MISFEDAYQLLREIEVKTEIEKVSLSGCLGRVLAEDIVSTIDLPPFDKSAMDGFAVNSKDDSGKFKIVETIAAGDIPKIREKKGECARIMTGAMLPGGTDRVVKKEIVEERDGYMMILEEDSAINVCYKGEDVRIGDSVLHRGILIRPQEVAVLASMGLDTLSVFRSPKVCILTTGSEIVEPGGRLKEGQIFNSNAYALAAQIRQLGVEVEFGGTAKDDKKNIRNQIADLLEKNHVIIISGGVSMGDYDFVPQVLEEMGVKLHFQKVAVKPGKPTVFGTREDRVFFGLPGNPVSTFVIFEIFVKLFLYRMMGCQYYPLLIKGKMKKDFKRKRSERTAFIPVKYQNDFVEIIDYHGSAHLNALSKANGLLKIPAGIKEISNGSTVDVRPI